MVPDPVPLTELRRALVIKLRHHGDVLLTSPVISVLKRYAPHVEVDALVYADTAPMLTLHPDVSEIFTIDKNWKRQGLFTQLSAERALLGKLRARRYDLVVHLTEHPRGAWLARLCGARYAVAPKCFDRGRFWRRSFTHFYAQPANAFRHTVERNLDALRRLGIYPQVSERKLVLVPGQEAEAKVDTLLGAHGLEHKGFVHLHPTSRWLFKCWPVAHQAALIERLAAKGERVVLTAAPDSREAEMVRDILALVQAPVVNFAGELSLKELAAVSARAKLFVGVDSAPMHIAAAMGTPCVAIFGPSGEKEWGPWGVEHRVVSSGRHPCKPCGLDGCGGSKRADCLDTLSVDQVWNGMQECLNASF